MTQRATVVPAWLPAVALSAALAGILLVWDPHVRDLAAQTFRAELFEQAGFSIWNGSWYQGHYTLTYSVLFPPLAALLGPMLVGALSVVASSYLFDRLVREHWGERARWATLWFAVGAVAMLANGNLTYSLGVAFGLASLRCLQRERNGLAIAAAVGCGLSSPVAAAFFGGVAAVAAAVSKRGGINRAALAAGAAAIAPVLLLNLAFPETARQPFSFFSFIAVPLWCVGGPLYLTRSLPQERGFRITVVAFVLATTLVWLFPNPLGDNAIRPLWLFGGPVLLAILLARRPLRGRRFPLLVAVVACLLAGYWQVSYAAKELIQSAGDPSTQASYYKPVERWLRAHGGERARIEVPTTLNTWEAAYLAPDFQLARGWLRQLDSTRGSIFLKDRLSNHRYRHWLRANGVRYVALADAPSHKFGLTEHDLVASGPDYLKLRWTSAHWRVYEVRHHEPLVQSDRGRATLAALRPESFRLQVQEPGRFTVLVRGSPFWALERGKGCVGERGRWTTVRAKRPGPMRVAIDFSLKGTLESAAGSATRC